MLRSQILGYGEHKSPIGGTHVGGEATVMTIEDCRDGVRADMLRAALTPFASHARTTECPHAYTLASCQSDDVAAHFLHDSDDFMPRDKRVVCEPELIIHHNRIGMADTAMRDADIDFIRAECAEVNPAQLQ